MEDDPQPPPPDELPEGMPELVTVPLTPP
ncbi:MAG: hypothetical protein QOE14_2910, partial [Humisphaera sp.]|nr:hypothetical protein [Humisphaera sp.]